jgi:hypothetical protein
MKGPFGFALHERVSPHEEPPRTAFCFSLHPRQILYEDAETICFPPDSSCLQAVLTLTPVTKTRPQANWRVFDY